MDGIFRRLETGEEFPSLLVERYNEAHYTTATKLPLWLMYFDLEKTSICHVSLF